MNYKGYFLGITYFSSLVFIFSCIFTWTQFFASHWLWDINLISYFIFSSLLTTVMVKSYVEDWVASLSLHCKMLGQLEGVTLLEEASHGTVPLGLWWNTLPVSLLFDYMKWTAFCIVSFQHDVRPHLTSPQAQKQWNQ